MELKKVRKGMLVECQQGIGKVLVIDEEARSVLIEEHSSRQQLALDVEDIIDNPQVHSDCHLYY